MDHHTAALLAAGKHLSDALTSFEAPPADPLITSLWVAMSLLQKAIRRGRHDLAHRAAASLLHDSSERLWRRLACIAYEDVGLGDFETVALATAAMAGKRARAEWGGEWKTASYLILRMAKAIKCRAADDLLLAADNRPDLENARLEFAFRSTDELIRISITGDPLPIRALATWYALGTDRRSSPRLSRRQGNPPALFEAFREIIPPAVVDIAQEGFRRTGEVLAPFAALLWPVRQNQTAYLMDDDFPPEVMIGGIPGWAFDIYTRPGRTALANFIEGSTESARWVRTHIPPRQRVTFLGTIVFRLEGGCVKSRLRWETGDALKRMVDIECAGHHCRDASEILQLVRADIPALNRIRVELIGGCDHV